MRENNMNNETNTDLNNKIQYDNVSFSRNGSKAWAIGISGSPEQIQGEFYAWINHGATRVDELTMVNENFGYFYTSRKRLKNAILSRESNYILNNDILTEYKGIKRGFWPIVEARAKAAFHIITECVPQFRIPREQPLDIYSMASESQMKAERPDSEEGENLGMTRNIVQDCIDNHDARCKKAERRTV